jgi:hypothetical protein
MPETLQQRLNRRERELRESIDRQARWRDTIDVPHPYPAKDCPTCSGSGIEEMRVADADKIDITCRACVAAEKECDVCGKMKPDVTLIHVYHAGDTSACEDCRHTQQ